MVPRVTYTSPRPAQQDLHDGSPLSALSNLFLKDLHDGSPLSILSIFFLSLLSIFLPSV